MGFGYYASDDAVAVTGAIDVIEGTVAADFPVSLQLLELMQTTDLGDAAEEVIRVGLFRGVTSGSGGTAASEQGGSSANPSAQNAITTFRTTASTGGTRILIFGWNIRVPTPCRWVPEDEVRIDSSDDPYSFRLMAAPSDSITCSVCHKWEEDG